MDWQPRISAWMAKHRNGLDVLLVLFFITGSSITAAVLPVEGSERSSDWLAYVLIVGAAACVWWRRRNPLVALPVGTALIIAYWVVDYPGGLDPVQFVLLYSATRHGGSDRTRVFQVTAACILTTSAVATVGVLAPIEDLALYELVGVIVSHIAAAVIGEAMYQRSRYVTDLEERAAMLEADLDTKTALAAVEERTRIAREMHDIIAHGMSTVVVQAQAGQSVVDADPVKTREVLTTIEHIGRDSVDEMRRMLGVLRDGNGELELGPQPSFDDLDSLSQHAEDAGIGFDISVTGTTRAVPPGLELTGYRVVQEALTNVMRHAGRPVQAEASITYHDDALEITVTDDGLGAAASPSTAGTGHGLLGMKERVEIYNGSFASGPRPGGGYQVQVTLPMPERANA